MHEVHHDVSAVQEYNSEHFNTAGRTIKTGLIAVDIVSHWTWYAFPLTSSSSHEGHSMLAQYIWGSGKQSVWQSCLPAHRNANAVVADSQGGNIAAELQRCL